MNQYRMLNDRILIEEIIEEQKGSIILIDSARRQTPKAKVLAVGPGITLDNGEVVPVQVSVGDVVLYNRGEAVEVTIDNKQYLVIEESEIYAIMEE